MTNPIHKGEVELAEMGEHNPNGWYASLAGPFSGIYCEIKGAQDEGHARSMCNGSYQMKRVWCGMYTLEEVLHRIGMYGGQIITIREL